MNNVLLICYNLDFVLTVLLLHFHFSNPQYIPGFPDFLCMNVLESQTAFDIRFAKVYPL